MEDTYKNPFSDYNANTMDSKKIISFWENPFDRYLVDITEDEIAKETNTIIFTGGRGTGKTMLLKHFAISSQIERARNKKIDFKDSMRREGYVGIYIRFDTPLLVGFEGLELSPEKWEAIFIHFFEMTVCKAFLDGLIKLIDEKVISDEEELNLINAISKLLGRQEELGKIKELAQIVADDINYVNIYKSEILFEDIEFKPYKLYTFGALSFKIVEIIKEICIELKDINFLLLLDEYENFLAYEQRVVNSAIKLSNNIAFRIGMRPMGFHTYATISENEFIKEHRDYRNVVFENHVVTKFGKGYYEFLLGIARKRLNSVKYFSEREMNDLRTFLGDRENIEDEARRIVKGKDKHIHEYLKEIKKVYAKKRKSFVVTEEQLERLRYPENPLYEMQNLRMLLKPFDIGFVIKAFEDYKSNIDSDEAKKYKNDYENKYKLSYLFVLCSIYKEEHKLYYGFNDFVYLSSGIVGTFLELCRCTFQQAYFSDKGALLGGSIDADIQTRAALDVANSEFEQIQRISKYGNYVNRFAKNIGDKFSEYHVDKRISYPETNQFSLDSQKLIEGSLEDKVFKAALMWSVVQRKKGLQQVSIAKEKGEVYILNRIFAPIFNISVRTRGGFNEELDVESFKCMIENEVKIVATDEETFEYPGQMTLFDWIEEE